MQVQLPESCEVCCLTGLLLVFACCCCLVAAALKPLGWARFLQPLSAPERANPLLAYYRRMLSPDTGVRAEAVSCLQLQEEQPL